MDIVIVGDGKVGFLLADVLSKEKHSITVIDSDPNQLRTLSETLDVQCVAGNGATLSVQREAGVEQADLLIAATSSDELNILSCLLAKKIGAGQTIARVRNPEYAEQLVFMKEELGLSMAVNPEQTAAATIARLLRFPHATNIDVFARGRVELIEFELPPGNLLDGLALAMLYTRLKVRILVCAVRRGADVVIPDGSFILQGGDRVTVTAAPSEMHAFFQAIGIYRQRIKRVMIVGGGRTSLYLARSLCDMGMRVTLIEKDAARARTLSELLPQAVVLHGNENDRDLLQEENIDGTDALVTATDSDEMNLLLSLYGRSRKVPCVVTKIERMDIAAMYGDLGSDAAVSPRQLAAEQIIRFVRSLENASGNTIETLHRIVDDRAEALEFRVRAAPDLTDRPLRDLKLKRGVLIAAIIRGMQVLIPGGSDVFREGDHVVVITAEKNLTDLYDICR